MCIYPGAVRFHGFDVSTSGFTGDADEWFSEQVGHHVQSICEAIMGEMLGMEHQGLITQDMLDHAKKRGLKAV